MNPKVSIIIPAYNVENEVERALSSIQKQTHKNLEIIVIDDGSTDNTLKIVQEIARTDQRITIISQENSGQSRARNRGLELSTGEYIYFFDADDYLDDDAIFDLLKTMNKFQVEVVTFNANIFQNDKSLPYIRNKKLKNNYPYTRDVFLKKSLWNISPVWVYFFKKDFLIDNKIKFVEGIIYEDNLFYIDIMKSLKSIAFVNRSFFTYQKRNASTTGNLHANDTRIHSFKIIQQKIKTTIDKNYTSNILTRFLNYRYNVAVINIIMLESGEKTISRLRYMRENNLLSMFNIIYVYKQYLKKIIKGG